VGSEVGDFFRTSDGFTTIQSTNTTFGEVRCLFFVNDTLGFAGTDVGEILRTEDGGITWAEQASGATGSVRNLFFVDAQLGFACVYGPWLLRTTDGGSTWAPLTVPEDTYPEDIHFFNAEEGVAVCLSGLIIRTVDGGDTWTPVTSPTTQSLLDLTAHGDVVVACGTQGHVIRSTDAGLNWSDEATDARERLAVELNSAGVGLMTANGTVYRTLNNGATWQTVYLGTPHTILSKVSFANDQIGVTTGISGMGGVDPGFLRTTDGGRHWSKLTGGGLAVHLRADGVGTSSGGRTNDFFATTQNSITVPAVAIRSTQAFTTDTYIVAGGNLNGGFYRTTDHGANWAYTAASNPYDMHFPTEMVGYAAGEGNNAYKTEDGGVTWTDLGAVVPNQQFTVFFLDEQRGWTGGAGAGALTIDGGASWTIMGSIPSYTKSIIFTDADTGYAVGQSGQTVLSTDGGLTWTNYVTEVFNATMGDAALADGALIAVGKAGDIYRAQLECPPVAVVPTVTEVGGMLYADDGAGYQWYVNDEPIAGADGRSYTPMGGGLYHVVVTDALGCVSAPSLPIDLVVTATNEVLTPPALRLYPNPAKEMLLVSATEQGASPLELIDLHGHVVVRSWASTSTTALDVSFLTSGVYTVRCIGKSHVTTARFVKE
jgi:photosystem II stability/assembly factor-like uncharacterized protein